MGCVRTCDICGREEREIDCGSIDHYKLKKEFHSWWESGWERVDVCTDCERELRRAVKNKGVICRITPRSLDQNEWPMMDEFLKEYCSEATNSIGVRITPKFMRDYLDWCDKTIKEALNHVS